MNTTYSTLYVFEPIYLQIPMVFRCLYRSPKSRSLRLAKTVLPLGRRSYYMVTHVRLLETVIYVSHLPGLSLPQPILETTL